MSKHRTHFGFVAVYLGLIHDSRWYATSSTLLWRVLPIYNTPVYILDHLRNFEKRTERGSRHRFSCGNYGFMIKYWCLLFFSIHQQQTVFRTIYWSVTSLHLLHFLCGASSIPTEQSRSLSWYRITSAPLPFVVSNNSPKRWVSKELWLPHMRVAGGEVIMLDRNLLCNMCTFWRDLRANRRHTGEA
jgi:hypothetical protein